MQERKILRRTEEEHDHDDGDLDDGWWVILCL